MKQEILVTLLKKEAKRLKQQEKAKNARIESLEEERDFQTLENAKLHHRLDATDAELQKVTEQLEAATISGPGEIYERTDGSLKRHRVKTD